MLAGRLSLGASTRYNLVSGHQSVQYVGGILTKQTIEEEAFEAQERVVNDLFENLDLFEEQEGDYMFIELCSRRTGSGDFLTQTQWKKALRLHSKLPK